MNYDLSYWCGGPTPNTQVGKCALREADAKAFSDQKLFWSAWSCFRLFQQVFVFLQFMRGELADKLTELGHIKVRSGSSRQLVVD